METAVISSSELKIEAVPDSSNVTLSQRRIEFHRARKPFDGFSNKGGASFHIETLNPSAATHSDPRKQAAAGGGGRKRDGSGFMENGLDPELDFAITFRRIGAGLENLGNTCFLNSVLQCLTYTEPLAAYLQSGKHGNSCHIAGFCALCAIQKHVSRALQLSGRSLAPKDLVLNLRSISRNFRNARQEDAHEYMVNLLESMHKCCLPSGVPSESPGAYDKSLVHKIFGGRLRSQVKCLQCSYCSDKFDPFLDLSLEINEADSLHKALKNFTAPEMLDDGQRQYQCQQCKQKVRALKQLTVHKAPHVLTIHLKRFRSYDRKKLDKRVSFGSTLDMKPFVSGSDDTDLKYTLYGVLVHYGWHTHSGHYSCFVRTSCGMWHSLDDNRVRAVSERDVLNEKAYMLFYVRDRKTFAPRKPVDIQKEHLKTNGSGNKLCPIVSQQSKDAAQNGAMENRLNVPGSFKSQKTAVCNGSSQDISVKEECLIPNRRAMAERSIPKDCERESALSASTLKNLSGMPSKLPDLGAHKPSPILIVNGNGRNTEIATSTAYSKGNGFQENGISDKNLGVSSTNGPSNTALNKLDMSGASQKININSHNDVSQVALSVDSGNKSADRLKNSVSSVSTVHVELLNKPSCDQAGDDFSANASENLANKTHNGIRRDPVTDTVEMSASSDRTDDSLNIEAKDGVCQRKLKKKKSLKRHSTSVHVGLKLFHSSLGMRKKKHKRTKQRSLHSQDNFEKGLNECCVPSDFGPSTSEKSLSNTLVSSHLGMRSCEKTRPNCNGRSSINTIEKDVIERQNDNGVVLATKQLEHCSGPVMGANKQNARELLHSIDGRLNGPVRKLTGGLEKTVLARWDDLELPPAIEVKQNTSIGYVLDEWDEEYDLGKRKKRRQPKESFDGSNPFQEISMQKSNFKRAKMDRGISSNQPFRIK